MIWRLNFVRKMAGLVGKLDAYLWRKCWSHK